MRCAGPRQRSCSRERSTCSTQCVVCRNRSKKQSTCTKATTRLSDLLEQVGIPRWRRDAYPHELSGGQKQRVMIAMALACDPELLIADEPTTALDVMVQAQVLQLLADLQRDRGLAMIFITHDLSVLSTVADRLAVMYAGRLVETGPAKEMLHGAKHPYTKALAAAFPTIGDPASRLAPSGLAGDPPDPSAVPAGCPFHPVAPSQREECATTERRAPRALGGMGGGVSQVVSTPLLQVSGAKVTYAARHRGGLPVTGGRRRRSGGCRRRGRRPGRRERLRQDHPRSLCVGLQPLTAGSISFDGSPLPTSRSGLQGVSAQGATRLSGSDRQHQSSPIDLRDRRRGLADSSRTRQ